MGKRHLTEPVELVALESMLMGSAAIENQEKRGQSKLSRASMLPVTILSGTREQFEAMGIRFHDTEADEVFVPVDLPEGWAVVPTSHSMWSKLCDEKGRERAAIFYKAAFYDRSAHMALKCRYRATYQPVGGWEGHEYGDGTPMEGVVMDGDEIIWRGPPQSKGDDYNWSVAASADASSWLDEHRPEWCDPLAYWDDRA